MEFRGVILGFFAGVIVTLLAGVLIFGDKISGNDEPQPETSESQTDITDTNEDTAGIEFISHYRGAGDRNNYQQLPRQAVGILINSQTELNDVWAELFKATLAPPKPSVNFSERSLLVAMSAQKPSAGYSASVQSIALESDKLVVNLEDKSPGGGCLTTKMVTRPVHIVSMAKTDLSSVAIGLIPVSDTPCKVQLN